MTNKRKPTIVKQTLSQPPPRFVQMSCECGQIFRQSSKLTQHLFKKHIYSPQFQKMKSFTDRVPAIGQQYKTNCNQNKQIKQGQQISGDFFQVMSSRRPAFEKLKKKRGRPKLLKFDKQSEKSLNQMQLIQLNNQKVRKSQEIISPQAQFSALNQSSYQPTNKQQNNNWLKRQRRRTQNRQFHNSRTFMCGQCLLTFDYSAELNVHISIKHNGQFPDGSIFGLKKNQILNFFKISTQKLAYPPLPERERRFKCGCGSLYTASSSLMHHIKSRHNSIAPPGTIDLFQSKRIKKLTENNSDLANASQ